MLTAQQEADFRKVFGDKFESLRPELERISEQLQNKPADSVSDVSASAQPVEAEPPAVESLAKLSEVDQCRNLLGSARVDHIRHEFWLKIAKKFPELQASVDAHFSPLIKPSKPLSKKHQQVSNEQVSINSIKHNLWHPGCTPSQSRLSSSRFILNNTEWSEANRQWAEAEIARYEASIVAQPVKDEPKSVLRPSIGHCKVDPAIGRAVAQVGHTVEYRAYCVARQHNVDTLKGSGYVSSDDLKKLFISRGICDARNFYRLLDRVEKAGFWIVERGYRSIKGVYLTGLQKLAFLVLSRLSNEQLEDFRGNQAPGGGRMIWVDCSGGSIQEFRGRLLDAWFEQRSEDGVKISNARLAQMWGVTEKTIQNRRTRVGLTGTANYADGDASIAPAHAVEGADGKMKWQMVNTYVATDDARRHSHRGQQHKVRKVAKIFIKSREQSPAEECAGGQAKQRYFDGKTPLEAEKLAHKAIAKKRADEIIYLYQEPKRFSRRSHHERYHSKEAYTA